MKSYRTKSGSVYDVDGDMIRRRVRSSASQSERVSQEWRKGSIQFDGIGSPLIIVWGLGADEHSSSPNTQVVGDTDGGIRIRTTVTTPIVEVLDPPELC